MKRHRAVTAPPLALAALAFGLTVALQARSAQADPCPGADPRLADASVEVRLRFLASTFDREIQSIDIWSWTWGSVYAAAAVTQASILLTVHDQGVRTGLSVGAISAGGGSLALFGLPLQITLPLRAVRRGWDDADRCALLLRAEEALDTGARHEALSNGLAPHIGNVLVNVGIGLILGLGYNQWKSGAISAGVGTIVGEGNAFTQPHRLRAAQEAYQAGNLSVAGTPLTWAVAPWTDSVSGAWGAGLRVTF